MKPFAEVSIVQRINEHSSVQQYKYFKVLIQEFHVKVDIGFINALVKMFEANATSDDEEVSSHPIYVYLVSNICELYDKHSINISKKMYVVTYTTVITTSTTNKYIKILIELGAQLSRSVRVEKSSFFVDLY